MILFQKSVPAIWRSGDVVLTFLGKGRTMYTLSHPFVSHKCHLWILLILSALAGVCTALALSGCNAIGGAAAGAASGAWRDIKAGSRMAADVIHRDQESDQKGGGQ